MKKLLATTLALALASFGQVQAASITMDFDWTALSSVTYNHDINTSDSNPNRVYTDGTLRNRSHGAGAGFAQIDMNDDGITDWTSYSYCVELTQSIGSNTTDLDITLLDVNAISTEVSGQNYAYAAWLMHNNQDVTNSGTKVERAALQAAIWEVMYDGLSDTVGDALDDSGIFDFMSTGTVLNDFSTYLSELFIYADSRGDNPFSFASMEHYKVAKSDRQDHIVYNPVPLPGAIWLFGSALVGFAGFRKYRRS